MSMSGINAKQAKRVSKFLSLVLRHQPQEIALQLDSQGWADVEDLIQAVNTRMPLNFETLDYVVQNNDKKRFAFNAEKTRIRASQGHSIEVDLAYEAQTPPEFLYHGTTHRALDAIRREGLKKRRRQHVHLSSDQATARNVGQRHGPPVVLKIRALELNAAGQPFFLSANAVWLVDGVPPEYLIFP